MVMTTLFTVTGAGAGGVADATGCGAGGGAGPWGTAGGASSPQAQEARKRRRAVRTVWRMGSEAYSAVLARQRSPRANHAPNRSPIIKLARFVFALGMVGMMLASATWRFS